MRGVGGGSGRGTWEWEGREMWGRGEDLIRFLVDLLQLLYVRYLLIDAGGEGERSWEETSQVSTMQVLI